MSGQLLRLAQRFPKHLVKKPPKGKRGEYIPHAVINERLLEILGPFDFQVMHILRGQAEHIVDNQTGEVKYSGRSDAIVGVVARLTVTIDGRTASIEEAGSEDHPAMHNDAENLKNAMSDALKRCAMRLGVGLHLWSQDDYRLDKVLDEDAPQEQEAPQRQEAPKKPASKQRRTPAETPISEAAAKRLAEGLQGIGVTGNEQARLVEQVTGRQVTEFVQLTQAEAKAVWLEANGGDPDKQEAEATA